MNTGTPTELDVRSLRIEIDKFINSTKHLNPSREISLCHTALQKSKAWLGMVLGEMGTPTPYTQSSTPSSSVIEKQAEHVSDDIFNPGGEELLENTQTAYVKYFRQEIGILLSKFDTIYENIEIGMYSRWAMSYLIESRLNLIESKHWLGWELDRIRNEKNGSNSTPRTPRPL